VFKRAGSHCQRCGVFVSDRFPEWDDRRAHVNELTPRSLGGDPCDPANCELVCRRCHFGGPSGAHAPTPERMEKRRIDDEGL
jgi:5-methylcytosine-specific restriction endonuclease McrA